MHPDTLLSSYHYNLPEELIAQHPAANRDESRLMVLNQQEGTLTHQRFDAIESLIPAGDMLVVNNTKVFPARMFGYKETGGKTEVFLLDYPRESPSRPGTAYVKALIKSSKRPKVDTYIHIAEMLRCRIMNAQDDGSIELELLYDPAMGLMETLSQAGHVPLPPYIRRNDGDRTSDVERYQTVYADKPGAVAAPTAGLHFTRQLLQKLTDKGVKIGSVILHVGYGTFAPVREEDITRHQIHKEYFSITEDTVRAIRETRECGGKIWAVGTTSVRALEYAASRSGILEAQSGWCDLYIYPGFQFQVIDNLITNFHLPDSSLMFLVAALCGRETLLSCYHTAIAEGYRFYSYGDAMAIIGGRISSR